MTEIITPADRAAKVRRDLERIFGRYLFIDREELFDRLRDILEEALIAHETDVRREEEVGE
jgi:hypothetical protein